MHAGQPVPLATMVAAWAVASRRPRPVGWALGGGAAVVLLLTLVNAQAGVAAYRIVQEALTNATKHAPGSVAHVVLHRSGDSLALSVTNGRATRPVAARGRPATGTGHGLIGMRERALACGGTLTTERSLAGGFVVRATIPVQVDDDGGPTTVEGRPA